MKSGLPAKIISVRKTLLRVSAAIVELGSSFPLALL